MRILMRIISKRFDIFLVRIMKIKESRHLHPILKHNIIFRNNFLNMASKNMQEVENLAIEVEKTPCLYDNASAGYKEKDRKASVCKAIDKALGLSGV